MHRFLAFVVTLLGLGVLSACGSPDADGPDQTAEVVLMLSEVPSGIQCIRVNIDVAGQTLQRRIPVATGTSSSSVSLGQLPAGSATFTGLAFDFACFFANNTAVPDWISDAETVLLAPGVVTALSLTFRPNNPVTVDANFLDNVAAVAVGRASYALMGEGTVKEWGNSGDRFSEVPAEVPGLADVVQVAPGPGAAFGYACARRSDGSVACWGSSGPDQRLGPNAPANFVVSTPVEVPLPGAADDLSAGSSHVCAVVRQDGVYCWGGNANGQFGVAAPASSATPVRVSGGGVRVFAGADHTCLITGNGAIFCGGLNTAGQVGNGNTTSPALFGAISSINPEIRNTIDLSLGSNHSCAVRADGVVHCWGSNSVGQLGDGTTTSSSSPVQVAGLTNAIQVVTGIQHTCALGMDGTVSCWGLATQTGDGGGEDHLTPATVPELSGVVAVRSHATNTTCVELGDLTVKCWGSNVEGQIGNGTFEFAPLPTEVDLQ
jgi:hypothetical protein